MLGGASQRIWAAASLMPAAAAKARVAVVARNERRSGILRSCAERNCRTPALLFLSHVLTHDFLTGRRSHGGPVFGGHEHIEIFERGGRFEMAFELIVHSQHALIHRLLSARLEPNHVSTLG